MSFQQTPNRGMIPDRDTDASSTKPSFSSLNDQYTSFSQNEDSRSNQDMLKFDTTLTEKENQYPIFLNQYIRNIQQNSELIDSMLNDIRNSLLSKRQADLIHSRLQEMDTLISKSQEVFQEWTFFLSECPYEKIKQRSTFESLSSRFHSEVLRVQEISNRVKAEANRFTNTTPGHLDANTLDTQTHYNPTSSRNYGSASNAFHSEHLPRRRVADTLLNATESESLCDDNDDEAFIQKQLLLPQQEQLQHDHDILESVSRDRLNLVQRIQRQINQVNQMFRDLGDMVSTQDRQIDSLNSNVEEANLQSKLSVNELRDTYIAQRRAIRRRIILFLIVGFVLWVMMWMSGAIPLYSIVHSNSASTPVVPSPNAISTPKPPE